VVAGAEAGAVTRSALVSSTASELPRSSGSARPSAGPSRGPVRRGPVSRQGSHVCPPLGDPSRLRNISPSQAGREASAPAAGLRPCSRRVSPRTLIGPLCK
jgi:hypothetical protein